MTLYDAAFRKGCEYLDQCARRGWGSRFLGRRLERRCAGGSEFVGHTDYTSGDDFRYLDWPICARHDELLTRQFRGSEDRSVDLLIDGSPGMSLGTPSKFDAARRLAGALGYLALTLGDRVTVTLIADRVVDVSPTVRGRNHACALYRFLDQQRIVPRAIDLRTAIDGFMRNRQRRGLVIVLSDLFDPAGFETAIDRLARRGFEPFLLHVVSDFDADPELSGGVRLVDVGSNRELRTEIDQDDLRNYRAVFAEFTSACRRYCGRRSIGFAQTRSSEPFQQAVSTLIRTTTARLHAR